MCTIVVLHQARADLPLVVAANRDEFLDRAATPPRRVIETPPAWAGLDAVAGGTWMGATEGGFFVGVTNQRSHRPPDRSRRSRGQLALDVLARGSVAAAEAFLRGVDARDYNDFNLLVGEPGAVTVVYGRRERSPDLELEALPPGVHVLANDRLGSPEFPKADRAAALVRPALGAPWPSLRDRLEAALADRERPPLDAVPAPPLGSTFSREIVRELQAICIRMPRYGTRSATVLAADRDGLVEYRFADGAPDEAPFRTIWSRDARPARGPAATAPRRAMPAAMSEVRRIVEVLRGDVPVGSRVTVQGWVRTRRDSKAGLSFVNVHDGSCFDPIQVVTPGELPEYREVLRTTSGCAVRVEGEVVPSQGKGQSVELRAERFEVVGWVEDPDTYPMQPKRHSMEYLREVAHLRPRTNVIGAVTRVRNTLAQAVHRFFHERGFSWIHTPIITASDAEGAGEMFRVSTLDLANLPRTPDGAVDFDQDFFGREAFLTVSGQLNVEAYCCAMSRVYTFGPTFRAENSNTRRHLAEFWMIEPEIAFADLDDDVDLAEAFLKSIFRTLLDERADDMAFFAKFVERDAVTRLEKLVEADFERMTYTDAIRHLEHARRKFEFPVAWGADLQSEHERWLTEELVGRPVAVTNYPTEIKAFYMRLDDDERTVAAMDVLAPGVGEIIGGSQREERLEVLDRRLDALGLPKERYGWYRDLRRYGTVPHAGFGLGFERAVQYATGLDNIRDVIPFPRAPRQADF